MFVAVINVKAKATRHAGSAKQSETMPSATERLTADSIAGAIAGGGGGAKSEGPPSAHGYGVADTGVGLTTAVGCGRPTTGARGGWQRTLRQ